MDERSILLAQIEALDENLNRAKKVMDAQQIDPELRKAVRNRFEWLINNKQNELMELRTSINRSMPMDSCWNDFQNKRKECGLILSECLAFIEGVLVRSARIDDGICEVADALLAKLSDDADVTWQRFTIMGKDEFFTKTTEIIRMRFPEFSIWNLPIVCHELGHFVGEEMRKSITPDIFVQILQEEGKRIEEHDIRFLHEQFADLFAVYAMGPAFACTCILLHFDPMRAYEDGEEHPADAKRVHFILKALEEMDKASMPPIYIGIIDTLRKLWQRSLTSAGKPEKLSPDIENQLNERLDKFYVRVIKKRLIGVEYKGWPLAGVLSPELLSDKDVTQVLANYKVTLLDVLNAAWLCRIRHWSEDGSRISQKSLKLCLEIVQQRRNS
jgi:hypothetical protein